MNTRPSVMARFSLGVSALLLAALGAEAGGGVSSRAVASGLGRPTAIVAADGDVLLVGLLPAKPTTTEHGSIAGLDVEVGDLVLRYSGPLAPAQVALDRDGNLYWTSRSGGALWRQDAKDGTVRRIASGLHQPSGIAVDSEGRVYFTEGSGRDGEGLSGNVSMLDGDEATVLRASEAEPADLAAGKGGDLYWTNADAGTIAHLTTDGTLEIVLAGLDRPQGLALDEARDRLYFTEVPTPGLTGSGGGRNTVNALNLATRERTVLHRGDSEPADVAVSPSGRVFWTSTRTGQVFEASAEDDDEDDGKVELEARLTGEQEVPPVESEASGRVKLKLIAREEDDDDDDVSAGLKAGGASAELRRLRGRVHRDDDDEDDSPRLEYRLKLKDITGANQGHLHLGAPGVNGPVVATLFALREGPKPDGKLNIAGVVSPDELVGPFADDWDGFVAALLGGQLYANVHTDANPGGEIRGQVLPKGTAQNRPPNGVILTPAGNISVEAGIPVSFAGKATDPDGDMVTVVWDFGDGTGSTDLVPPAHVYAEPGEYDVKLTATDSRGLADPSPDRREITVTLLPPPTPSPSPTATPPAPTPTPTVPGPTATPTPTVPGPTATPTVPPPTPTPTVPGPTATPTPTTPPPTPTMPAPTPTPTMPPPSPTPTTPPPSVTLSSLQTTVFTAKCIGCHGGSSPEAGMNLSAGQSFSNLVNVPATTQAGAIRVVPFSPSTSYLSIFLAAGHRSNSVTVQDRADIDSWILAGALNN
ncbi:MAG: CHRD domain-containing protein [Acidobacteria bacterium]|nr:CHRD domain-containing protein [Acidobacteriota bacterium]